MIKRFLTTLWAVLIEVLTLRALRHSDGRPDWRAITEGLLYGAIVMYHILILILMHEQIMEIR